MKLPLRNTPFTRKVFGTTLLAFVLALVVSVPLASGADPTATFTYWNIGADPIIQGFDPHQTVDDATGLTNHVGAPTMFTSMENGGGGFCGVLFWNPDTNAFKEYKITGGFQFAGAINRGTPAVIAGTPGGGDAWATVNG